MHGACTLNGKWRKIRDVFRENETKSYIAFINIHYLYNVKALKL